MQVRVRYFAVFREVTGVETEVVDTGASSARELFSQMADRHADLHFEAAALVAVNDVMADWETALSEGDEVLFFPPVAGG